MTACIFKDCVRPVVELVPIGQFTVAHCAIHRDWLAELADDRYRVLHPSTSENPQRPLL